MKTWTEADRYVMSELELAAVEVVTTDYAIQSYEARDPMAADPIFDALIDKHRSALQRLARAVGALTHG